MREFAVKPIGYARYIDNQGKVTIPYQFRNKLAIGPGDKVEVIMTEDNDLLIRRGDADVAKKNV